MLSKYLERYKIKESLISTIWIFIDSFNHWQKRIDYKQRKVSSCSSSWLDQLVSSRLGTRNTEPFNKSQNIFLPPQGIIVTSVTSGTMQGFENKVLYVKFEYYYTIIIKGFRTKS